MDRNTRIERLIREARVQRSAAIGAALGEFLGQLWLGTAELLRRAPAVQPRVEKHLQAR